MIAAFWKRPWLWGWVIASLVCVPLLSFRHQSELTGCYLPAARRFSEGLALPGAGGWLYPPVFVVPVLPLVWLPLPVARILWCLGLVGCAVLSARCIWEALMGDAAFRKSMKSPARFLVLVLGLALSSAGHAVVPLGYQSHDLVVMALICAATLQGVRALDPLRSQHAKRHERMSGTCLGLAASCKVMPVLFLPALVADRRWRASLWMGVTGVACAVGFDLVSWALTGRPHFIAWLHLAAGGSDLTASGGGRWSSWNPLNQSMTGVLSRLMVPTPSTLGLEHECMLVAVGESGRRVVLACWELLVVGILLITTWWTSRMWRERFGVQGAAPVLHVVALAGAVSCAYLVIAPHTSNYHFAPVAIAAAAMLAWLVTRGRDPTMIACLAIMIGLSLLPGRDVLGSRLTDIKLAYGSIAICAVSGLVGALRVMVVSARPWACETP